MPPLALTASGPDDGFRKERVVRITPAGRDALLAGTAGRLGPRQRAALQRLTAFPDGLAAARLREGRGERGHRGAPPGAGPGGAGCPARRSRSLRDRRVRDPRAAGWIGHRARAHRRATGGAGDADGAGAGARLSRRVAARRHREREDRGLPAPRAGSGDGRTPRSGPGSGDRVDAGGDPDLSEGVQAIGWPYSTAHCPPARDTISGIASGGARWTWSWARGRRCSRRSTVSV